MNLDTVLESDDSMHRLGNHRLNCEICQKKATPTFIAKIQQITYLNKKRAINSPK